MIQRTLLAALLLGSLAACGSAPAEDIAGRCAEVVRIHRDLQGPAVIVGQPVRTSEGNVEIEYEGTDAMNSPVRGSASCTFAVGEGGSLDLVEAVVDGSPLSETAIESIRR